MDLNIQVGFEKRGKNLCLCAHLCMSVHRNVILYLETDIDIDN